MCVSDWLTVEALTRASTSPAAGAGRSTSSMRRTSGGPYRSWTTARIKAAGWAHGKVGTRGQPSPRCGEREGMW